MTADEILFDEVLAQGLDILRLSASAKTEVIRRLRAMEKDLSAKLAASELNGADRRKIEAFLVECDAIIGAYYGDIVGLDNFRSVAEYVAGETIAAFIAIGYDAVKKPSSDYLRSVQSDVLIQGAPSRDWWNGQSEDTKRKFKAEVRQGLVAGETNQQIVARIVGKGGAPGIMETVRRNAQTLVQTSVQTVANDARRATFDANDDIVKGFRQISTLDGHTTIICVSYSGAEWDKDRKPINGNDLPFNGGCPRHWNCRSLEVPITKTFRELGLDIDEPEPTQRASSAGPIDAKTTFDDFLKRQGKAYQDRVLGTGRAELWRDGKITLRDLVSGTGAPITLDELRDIAAKRRRR